MFEREQSAEECPKTLDIGITELDSNSIEFVAGGLNPQPLPPGHVEVLD